MGLFRRGRQTDTASLAKAIAAELAKANLTSSLPAGTTTVSPPVGLIQSIDGKLTPSAGFPATPMARDASVFGALLGPATPLIPSPLDAVDPITGRAAPRRNQAEVAANLNLTKRRTPWTVLKALADQCDVIHRCIEIRVSEIASLSWDFTLSDHVITRIMADDNVTLAEASKRGRAKFGAQIDQLKEFWETPGPGDQGFAEWVGEFLWNHYVLDAAPLYPRLNLGGQVLGFENIDGATIKPLLNNRGFRPQPPYPAYQQILWGFPRGEWTASLEEMVDNSFTASVGGAPTDVRDQLAYFARNVRAWEVYGYSSTEAAIPAATLYLNRQGWLQSEYTDGALPQSWLKTDSDFAPPQLKEWENILNDFLSGQTSERHRLKVLPKGFDPIQMQMMAEKYSETFDEYLIKQIGSKFGVAPTQLGVIPRTGLGGKGQQEGEMQQAETLSQQPTEEWLIDVLNILSRRFLGASRDITATFTGGDTAQDALMKAQTAQAQLSTGQITVNQVQSAAGRPLYEMPEADEPFLVTGSGVTFLSGLMAQQESAANRPPPPVMVAPGVPQSVPAVQNPTDTPPSDAKAETGKFLTFAAKRAKQGTWRDFVFAEVDQTSAAELNKLGKAGDLDAVRQVMLGKASGRPGAGGHREQTLANHYRAALVAGLSAEIDPQSVAEGWAKVAPVTKDAPAPDPTAATPTPSETAAAAAYAATWDIDPEQLATTMRELWAESYVAGAKDGADQLKPLGLTVSTDFDQAVASIGWANWTPGYAQAASELAGTDGGRGLAALLDRADITIQGLTDTTRSQLADVLATAVARGDAAKTTAKAVAEVVANPDRAEMIARTEVNRAMTVAALDTYQAAGLAQYDWLASPGACAACLAEEADNPHDISDGGPPEHPNCRCAAAPTDPTTQES